jgi:3'-5' exonuclease
MNLFIDIETIPAQRPDVMEEIKASIKAPGQFKKPESIAEWLRTEGPSAVEDAYRKTGLDGAYGQICVVGLAVNDFDPVAICELDWEDPGAERRILETLGCQLTDLIAPNGTFTTCVIGHNVSAFDLRFLLQRSIVNGIRPHATLARAAQAKPWEGDKVFDTMVQWTGSASVRINLDKLCKALSIPTPKDGITGAMVWDAVRDGRIDEVAAYCLKDVTATREAYKRMTFQMTQAA